MVSKGQFVGLDWNRITRLHSQVMTGTQELTNSKGLTSSSLSSLPSPSPSITLQFSAVSLRLSKPRLSSFPQIRDTTTLSARYEQYQGWLTTMPSKYVRQTKPPTPVICILRDSSKCTNPDGYYCHYPLWILLI